jgi:uncharacterized protein
MPFIPENALVWTEIPVTDLPEAVKFYSAAFGYDLTIDDSGPNPMAMLPFDPANPGTAGHLYTGNPPARGSGLTVHLAVPDTVEKTAKRFRAAGGEVLDPVIEIPPGRFAYGLDPDGNSIGLFQPAA